MKIAMRQERIARGWTQDYVAKKCGVSYQTVCDWENNRRKPSYDVLVKLEDLFKMNHRELFKVEVLFRAATLDNIDKPDGNPADQ